MTTNFEIKGLENLKVIMQEMPENGFRKPVMAAFRKAARPIATAMGRNLPRSISAARRIIKIKPGKGTSLAVGFFPGLMKLINRRGKQIEPFLVVNWMNYGTLANRLSTHHFSAPRRRVSANWKGGIRPGQFVEGAVEQALPEAQRVFEKEFEAQLVKFLEKNAAK